MAKIRMTGGFQMIPEGVHVLKITDAQYDEDFGKVTLQLAAANGATCTERFSLLNQDGSPNAKALNAFSFFAKTALNNFDIEDVDPVELVGHYIRAEVIHNKVPSNKEPGKMVTFINLGDKAPADGFDGVAEAPVSKPTGLDLNALLGG